MRTTFPTTMFLSLLKKIHVLTNTKFVHVTSTYYRSWILVFVFTSNVTYFHRVSVF